MADLKNEEEIEKVSQDQIDLCLEVLQKLNADTNQIFEIPKDKRLALIMAEVGFLVRRKRNWAGESVLQKKSRRKKSS